MDVVSASSLPVASLVWQPRASTWVLTVICKATYALQPGEATFAPEQEAPNENDNHWDDDSDRSVIAPSDLIPIKPRAEVLLVGQAFAPGRAPTRSLVARLTVGEVDKAIEVLCDRSVGPDGTIQEGSRFARMSLRYERAFGGPGTWNPVGVRSDARDSYGRRVLPNLRPAYRAGAEDPIEPVSFGPIAAGWPSRAEKLGRHAATFSPDALRDQPLPEGIDYEYFNQAPRDQHLSQLRDNERIALENLHPEHPRLITTLPGFRPAAFVDRGQGAGTRLSMRADTLWIDTDRAIATLTWRGQLTLEEQDEPGRVVVGLESAGQETTWGQVERIAGPSRGRPAARQRTEMTAVHGITIPPDFEDGPPRKHTALPTAHGPVLPFLPKSGDAPTDRPSPSPGGGGLPFQQRGPGTSGAWPAMPAAPPPLPPPKAAPGPATEPPAPPPAAEPVSPWQVAPPPPAKTGLAEASPWAAPPLPPAALQAPALQPPPPVSAPEPVANSLLGTSNAAAAATTWSLPRRDVRAGAALPDLGPEPMGMSRPALRLIWFDPESVARIRRVPRWKPILTALEDRPLDPERDEPAADQDPMAAEDRREIFEILARGDATDAEGVEAALGRAVRDDGKFVPPLVLVAGELEFPFDELETLKAVVSTATPAATQPDENLRASLEIAKDFLKTPGLSAPPQVSESMTNRIREAFAKEKTSLPGDFLDSQTERILLSERHYQKRELLGESHLRFLLRTPGEEHPLVGYLSAKVAKQLPMFRRFRGKMIAEAHLAEEQYETQPSSLRVLAILRVMELPARRTG